MDPFYGATRLYYKIVSVENYALHCDENYSMEKILEILEYTIICI
jgi:hypothetical protein